MVFRKESDENNTRKLTEGQILDHLDNDPNNDDVVISDLSTNNCSFKYNMSNGGYILENDFNNINNLIISTSAIEDNHPSLVISDSGNLLLKGTLGAGVFNESIFWQSNNEKGTSSDFFSLYLRENYFDQNCELFIKNETNQNVVWQYTDGGNQVKLFKVPENSITTLKTGEKLIYFKQETNPVDQKNYLLSEDKNIISIFEDGETKFYNNQDGYFDYNNPIKIIRLN